VLRLLRRLTLLVLVGAVVLGGVFVWWMQHPMAAVAQARTLDVPQGAHLREVARRVAETTETDSWPFILLVRITGNGSRLRAGTYIVEPGSTPLNVLSKLVRGDVVTSTVTVVEGWTFAQMRAAIAASPDLRHDASSLTDSQLMTELGAPGVAPEGRFFPDTYRFAKGSSDLALYRQAYDAMRHALDAAWAARAQPHPLASADELLILASIVEKETGQASDRPKIAAVFLNRLRTGMLLQTDPTVIYGMGPRFDGNLRRVDLLTDTPFNTYIRAGLPPTPIALPGKAAINAVVNPDTTDALYFVARGDGSSEFSSNLDAHNRAVNKFQRHQ